MATLVDDDELPHATEPGPWLAAVLTLPEHRSLGIASALIHRIIQRAHDLGHANLYLYTSDQQEWYAKKGWIPARETELNGIAHTVMRLPLQI
jgi:GNAT superfamily N-acetyltransferase